MNSTTKIFLFVNLEFDKFCQIFLNNTNDTLNFINFFSIKNAHFWHENKFYSCLLIILIVFLNVCFKEPKFTFLNIKSQIFVIWFFKCLTFVPGFQYKTNKFEIFRKCIFKSAIKCKILISKRSKINSGLIMDQIVPTLRDDFNIKPDHPNFFYHKVYIFSTEKHKKKPTKKWFLYSQNRKLLLMTQSRRVRQFLTNLLQFEFSQGIEKIFFIKSIIFSILKNLFARDLRRKLRENENYRESDEPLIRLSDLLRSDQLHILLASPRLNPKYETYYNKSK